MIIARLVDARGYECARAVVDPTAEIWYFALTRAAAPAHVELQDGAYGLFVPRIALQPCPMKDLDIVAVHVRATVSREMERVVLWLAAFTAWHLGRLR